MTMRTRYLMLGLVSLLVFTQAAEAQKAKAPRRDRNLIRLEEIEQAQSKNPTQSVYDLIRRLRSVWLMSRGNQSVTGASGGVVIYMDNALLGTVDELHSIPVDRVQEVRFLSASDATTRFGTGVPAGAIEVITKK